MLFSQEQQVFIVEQYFASRLYTFVVDQFCVKYRDVTVPYNLTITRLITHFRETVSVVEKKRTGRLAIFTDAKLVEVINVMLILPSKSLQRLLINFQILHGSAQKALKKLKFHAYQNFKYEFDLMLYYCFYAENGDK